MKFVKGSKLKPGPNGTIIETHVNGMKTVHGEIREIKKPPKIEINPEGMKMIPAHN